jgi:hypothetical protein
MTMANSLIRRCRTQEELSYDVKRSSLLLKSFVRFALGWVCSQNVKSHLWKPWRLQDAKTLGIMTLGIMTFSLILKNIIHNKYWVSLYRLWLRFTITFLIVMLGAVRASVNQKTVMAPSLNPFLSLFLFCSRFRIVSTCDGHSYKENYTCNLRWSPVI